MNDFDLSDLSSVDSARFAELVRTAPTEKMTAVMTGDQRGKVLEAIFTRMPTLFRPERAGTTNAVVHWNVGDRPDGGTDTYQLVIENGTCVLSPTPDREPKLALTLGAVDFLKVVSGNANPMMMFMTGKLKAKGDLGLAANIARLFDIPSS